MEVLVSVDTGLLIVIQGVPNGTLYMLLTVPLWFYVDIFVSSDPNNRNIDLRIVEMWK